MFFCDMMIKNRGFVWREEEIMYGKKIMAMAAGVILAVGAAGCGTEKQDDTTAIL